jgi:Sec-independent protein translocase protein TatA
MFDVAFSELLVVVAAGLVILGPDELTKVARQVREFVRGIRAHSSSLQQQINEILDEVPNPTSLIKGDDGNLYEAFDLSDIINDSNKNKKST